MNENLIILIFEAMAVYFLVLLSHSLRKKFGLYHFYALIGGITAVMSWITDAGIKVEAFGITFMIGSTVFYTSLLLAVFIIYVFDGPKATRIAISTIIVVSILVPLISVVLNIQISLSDTIPLAKVPTPSLRINSASVITTTVDLVFLAVAWEFLGSLKVNLALWIRTYLTLLGVMIIDVIIFNIGAFAGNPDFYQILQGTLISRFVISIFAFPFFLGYVYWQTTKYNIEAETRPVFSILKEVAEIKKELHLAKEEIKRQKEVEYTIRESLEKHIQLSEKLGKEKTMQELLLDVITHDLRNPAGVIKGIAELLKHEYPKDEMVEMVDSSIENLMSVIENATSLTMITSGEEIEKSELNLTELIQKSVKEFEHLYRDGNIEIINDIREDILTYANPIIIEIFKNFLSNALKYAYIGGKLIISSIMEEGSAKIQFKDFGETIKESKRDEIFQRNVRLAADKKFGRGIGLAIVKRIADAHNAEVGVEPNYPKGNIFYLKIKVL